MWTLVFIVFIGGKLESTVVDTYETMYECFNARETLSLEVGKGNGYFKPGSQAVCVYREDISVQHSLVVRQFWVLEVVGSNPATETKKITKSG